MKILIPLLFFDRAGGVRVLSELANNWVKKGHHVDFVVNEASGEPYFPTIANIKWVSITGEAITNIKRKEQPQRPLKTWRCIISLFFTLKRLGNNYDVILANHSLTAWPVSLMPRQISKKFYYIQAYEPEYFELEHGLKMRVAEWLSARSYNLDLKQICNAPMYIGYKKVRAHEWVPPGIDFNLYFPKKERKNLGAAEEIILGCIGRREPAKGIRYVLEAFEILWKQNQRIKLNVAYGNLPDGYSHPGLKTVIPNNDKELGEFYRSLDIMIAPGTVQLGAPHYPVMEAMACGVPVINTGYLPANENNSWIVPVANSLSIVDSVNTIIENQNVAETKAIAGLKDISNFGWETVSEKMLQIFQQ